MAGRDIGQALVDLLQADPVLAGLLPGGFYLERAPAGVTRYGIVGILDGQNDRMFRAIAIANGLYLVKAVTLGAIDVNAAAAARIQAVLEDAVLMVAGYTPMLLYFETPVYEKEPDEKDASIEWIHGGGQYVVAMST